MCLVVFSYQKGGSFTLAGNRDEFYNRQTGKAGFWEDIPGLIAGRDLKAGGTWLGMDDKGNIAFLTNFRDTKYFKEAEKSRGELLIKFFENPDEIESFSDFLRPNARAYNGYNLIFGNPRKDIYYFSNVSEELQKLDYGIYGLSNAYLDTSWPKLDKTKIRFEKALEGIDANKAFDILSDTELAKEKDLPDTGIDKEMEKQLSAPFIKMDGYGTRCSTFIQINKGEAQFVERNYDNSPENFEDRYFSFLL